jgi:hypothetical protein
MLKKQEEFLIKLSDKEIKVLKKYTHSSSYINGKLRFGNSFSHEKNIEIIDDIKTFDNLFLNIPPLENEIIVYRGIECEDLSISKKKEYFYDRGFVSTSLNKDIGEQFGDCLLKISIPIGSKVLPIYAIKGDRLYDEYPEYEILLNRGALFENILGFGILLSPSGRSLSSGKDEYELKYVDSILEDTEEPVFDMDEFLNVIFPLTLSKLSKYYITGERAYDFYFKNTTNIQTWNLTMIESEKNKLIKMLSKYAKRKGTRLITEEKYDKIYLSLRGINIGGKFYLVSISIKDIVREDYITAISHDGIINYLNFSSFVLSLITNYEKETKKPDRMNRYEEELFSKKLAIENKKLNEVIDITWSKLSNYFKKYLLSKCGEDETIELFNISETCKAYLQCDIQKVIRNTNGCKKST